MGLKKLIARETYETRVAWRQAKEDCTEVWQYWCFRARHSVNPGWRMRAFAWMLELREKLARPRKK